MKAIFHNDDFGLSYGFTEAIKICFEKGITTSTCIRTNGVAFDYAASLAKTSLKKIGMGIHLNVTEGPTHLEELANSRGHYAYSYPAYVVKLMKGDKKLFRAIEREFIMQCEMALNKGLKIDHINSQDHIHMIPPLFELTCKIAKRYHIKWVRLVTEPLHFLKNPPLNYAKWLLLSSFAKENRKILHKYNIATTDAFYGLLASNTMNRKNIINSLEDGLKRRYNTIEILGHPGIDDARDTVYTSDFIEKYTHLPARGKEYRGFSDKTLKNFLQKNNIQPIAYREM